MTESDLEAVLAIEQASFPRPWTCGLFLQALANPQTYAFVAASRTEVLGYGVGEFVDDECHVVNLAVPPSRRRERLGARCLLHLLETGRAHGARKFTLEVRATNAAALALYEKFGFIAVARRPRYYADDGTDAVIMWILNAESVEQQARLDRLGEELA